MTASTEVQPMMAQWLWLDPRRAPWFLYSNLPDEQAPFFVLKQMSNSTKIIIPLMLPKLTIRSKYSERMLRQLELNEKLPGITGKKTLAVTKNTVHDITGLVCIQLITIFSLFE